MIVLLHPDAEAELIAGATFYKENASKKIAQDFLAEFNQAINLLKYNPRLGISWEQQTRKLVLHRFPYSIVYYEHSGQLKIVAVAHQSRRPGYWRDRMENV